MKKERKYVSMDWAAKKLLRSKANYDILEGFLSELLKDDIKILSIGESESNKEDSSDKFNRVDLLVEDSKKRHVIVEIQFEREVDYFQRILYGVSRTLIDNIDEGQPYAEIAKVISVSIVYFNLGQGSDYIYHGTTEFTGLHQSDTLSLSPYQKTLFKTDKVRDLFPEFYVLKINQFDDIAKDSLDEWIYFFKNEQIKKDFTAKGLQAAKRKLDIMKLNEQERKAYRNYIENQRYRASMVEYSIKRAEEEARRAEEQTKRAEEQTRKAEEQTRKAEEQTRKAKEQTQKAEDQTKKVKNISQRAIKLLVKQGFTEEEARKELGL